MGYYKIKYLRGLTAAGADYVHIDVMDGLFVPNLSLGFPIISAIRRDTELPLDVHLMIEEPGRYIDDLAEVGADLCVHTMAEIEAGRAVYTRQDETLATHVGMLKKQFGKIDWTKPAEEIERLIRGLNPWPSAYTSLTGKTLKIWKASVQPGGDPADAGKIVLADKNSIGVQTGKDILILQEIQLEGKKRMSVDAFLRGFPVSAGTELG